ncbi:hypothetical protein CL638_01610 [bacterium]|jgi:hypothetical protein|nr:hypothetical protein [bacterium]
MRKRYLIAAGMIIYLIINARVSVDAAQFFTQLIGHSFMAIVLVSVGAMVYTTFREDFDALWETFSAWFCGRRSDWEELLAAANAAPMR